jgi:hypothetical protein
VRNGLLGKGWQKIVRNGLLGKGCGKTTVLSHSAKAKAFAWWRKGFASAFF